MKGAGVHIVIVGKDFLERNVDVLRTEVLMSESLDIEILGVEAPELKDPRVHTQVFEWLARDEIFRRITKLVWYKETQLEQLKTKILLNLAKKKGVFGRLSFR